LPRLITAFVGLWRRTLRIVAGKFGPVGAIATATMAPAPTMSETILAAVTLLVAIGTGVLLLRLGTATAGNERRQPA
jgi:hypothetical protein